MSIQSHKENLNHNNYNKEIDDKEHMMITTNKINLIPKKQSIRDQNILKTFCKDISKINELD